MGKGGGDGLPSLFAEDVQANGQGRSTWRRALVQPARVPDKHVLKGLKNFFDFLIDVAPSE